MGAEAKKGRTGRPRLADGEGRREVLIVRLSREEKYAIEDAAERAGEGVSEWLRNALLSIASGAKSHRQPQRSTLNKRIAAIRLRLRLHGDTRWPIPVTKNQNHSAFVATIDRLLSALPAEAQREVLTDLLSARLRAPVAHGQPLAPLPPAPRDSGEPRRRRARKHAGGRPKAGDTSGRTATLLRTLAEHPGISIGDLAKAVYGSDDETSRNGTRSILVSQSKRKPPRTKRIGFGRWEAINRT